MPRAARYAAVFVIVASTHWAFAEAPSSNAPGVATIAPSQLPPWMSEAVIKAALAIDMTDAQRHAFNDAIGDYVMDHFEMIEREAKREAPDLEQRVKSRDRSLLHKLDDRLHATLTTQQWPAYERYRKALQKELKSAPLPQQTGRTRAQPGVGGGRG